MQRLGTEVSTGSRPIAALLVVVALAVLREGSEIVLFLIGLGVDGSSASGMMAGGVLGLLGGAAVGTGLYFGLVRIPIRNFFTVTNAMILLLAAGMASHGARYLIDVDVRSEEHTSELQSLMRISYAVFCLKKKKNTTNL